MADKCGQSIDGEIMICGVQIRATIIHYDHQGYYANSLVKVFSTPAGFELTDNLIVTNVLEYIKQGRKNPVPQK